MEWNARPTRADVVERIVTADNDYLVEFHRAAEINLNPFDCVLLRFDTAVITELRTNFGLLAAFRYLFNSVIEFGQFRTGLLVN